MTYTMAYKTAASLVAELIGVCADLTKLDVTGEPQDREAEERFADLVARLIEYTQKGLMK